MTPRRRRGSPPADTGRSLAVRPEPHDEGYPLLSFRHIQTRFGVVEMSERQRSEFLDKWAKRCGFTWKDLVQHDRHGLGYEMLPRRCIRPAIPEHLHEEKYMVFRHDGNLPFAGFRAGDTLYVLWIEARYGDLYVH